MPHTRARTAHARQDHRRENRPCRGHTPRAQPIQPAPARMIRRAGRRAPTGGAHAPRQAPLRRARLPHTSPTRHQPMPHPHPRSGQGARHHQGTRLHRPAPHHPRPPHPTPPIRSPHLLALRQPHRPRRTNGPRSRRPRPVDHTRTRARQRLQQVSSRTLKPRTRAALMTLSTQSRRPMRSTAQRCDLQKHEA